MAHFDSGSSWLLPNPFDGGNEIVPSPQELAIRDVGPILTENSGCTEKGSSASTLGQS